MKGNALFISGWLLLVSIGYELAAGLGKPDGESGQPLVESGRVTRVVDGDTYDVLAAGAVRRVRLLGVDAPELDQPFGRQAADSVARLLPVGQSVLLGRQGLDLYGRTLATLRVVPKAGGGPALALDSLLVARGWAWAWDPRGRVAGRAAAQAAAVAARRGLWKCGPAGVLAPHQWRQFDKVGKRRYRVECAW